MDEPDFEREPPKCTGHGLPARVYESHKPDTNGRKFYRCPKPIGDTTQCKYFCWVDEYHPEKNAGTSSQSLTSLPTPQSADPHTAKNIISKDPPQTPTARKRSLSSFGEDHEETFSSQKRTKFEDEDEEEISSQPFTSQTNKFKPGASNSAWPPQTPPRKNTIGTSYSTPTNSQAFASQGLGPSASQETLRDTPGSNNEELTADSIADMLTRLSNTPQLVRKLERRRIAAEKSRDAKASKIASLEAEIERLKAREKELEAVITAYEQQE